MKYQVTPQQIENELYRIFSDDPAAVASLREWFGVTVQDATPEASATEDDDPRQHFDGVTWDPSDLCQCSNAARILMYQGTPFEVLESLDFGNLDLRAVWDEEHPTEEGTEFRAHDADGRPYGPSEKSPIRTKETEEINAALRLIPGNVMRDFGFISDGGTIVTNHGTPCLLHQSRGFLVMPDGPGVPYSPCGGSDALQSILDAGGFLNFDGFRFVWPIDHNADSIRRVLEVFGAV